jgi:hypothetical protein
MRTNAVSQLRRMEQHDERVLRRAMARLAQAVQDNKEDDDEGE